MHIFLTVALLVVGTAATLAAFGGETCIDEPGPILRRITKRGWISLVCLAIALGLGTWKEINEASAKRADELRHEREIAQADNANKALQKQLSVAQQGLKTIEEINGLLKTQVGETRDDLNATRDELATESVANLIRVLADQGMKIREAVLLLPVKKPHWNARDYRGLIFPELRNRNCDPLIDMTIRVVLSRGLTVARLMPRADTERHPDGNRVHHQDFVVPSQALRTRLYPKRDPDSVVRSRNLLGLYRVDIDVRDDETDLPSIFGFMTDPMTAPVNIEFLWNKSSPNAYTCGQELMSALPVEFDNALLFFVASTKTNGMDIASGGESSGQGIIFRLRAQSPLLERGLKSPIVVDLARVLFETIGRPEVVTRDGAASLLEIGSQIQFPVKGSRE